MNPTGQSEQHSNPSESSPVSLLELTPLPPVSATHTYVNAQHPQPTAQPQVDIERPAFDQLPKKSFSEPELHHVADSRNEQNTPFYSNGDLGGHMSNGISSATVSTEAGVLGGIIISKF